MGPSVHDHYGKLIFCLLWRTLWLLGQPNVFLGWLWNTLVTSLVYFGYSVLQVSGQEPSMSSQVPHEGHTFLTIFCLLWLTLWIWDQSKVFLGWLWSTLMTCLIYLWYPVLQVSGQDPSMSSKFTLVFSNRNCLFSVCRSFLVLLYLLYMDKKPLPEVTFT